LDGSSARSARENLYLLPLPETFLIARRKGVIRIGTMFVDAAKRNAPDILALARRTSFRYSRNSALFANKEPARKISPSTLEFNRARGYSKGDA